MYLQKLWNPTKNRIIRGYARRAPRVCTPLPRDQKTLTGLGVVVMGWWCVVVGGCLCCCCMSDVRVVVVSWGWLVAHGLLSMGRLPLGPRHIANIVWPVPVLLLLVWRIGCPMLCLAMLGRWGSGYRWW